MRSAVASTSALVAQPPRPRRASANPVHRPPSRSPGRRDGGGLGLAREQAPARLAATGAWPRRNAASRVSRQEARPSRDPRRHFRSGRQRGGLCRRDAGRRRRAAATTGARETRSAHRFAPRRRTRGRPRCRRALRDRRDRARHTAAGRRARDAGAASKTSETPQPIERVRRESWSATSVIFHTSNRAIEAIGNLFSESDDGVAVK